MESLRTVRNIRHQTKPLARCRGIAAQPAKKRTRRNFGNGFLSHTFKPFWLFDGNINRAETEYFRSLKNLCEYYDLLLPDTDGLPFPQNIYQSWQVISQRIEAIDKKLDCIILKDEIHEAVLATISQYDTGRMLYYIPLKPLSQWVAIAAQQAVAEVVLAIFAYLYQVAEVPLFSDFDTFLFDQYRYVEDMINEENYEYENESEENGSLSEEANYRRVQLDELYTLQNNGIQLGRLMAEKSRLERMEETVLDYANSGTKDHDLAILAIEFLQLYKAYPERRLFAGIRPDLYHPEIEERIRAQEYISFYWSGNDTVIETVMSMIDCSFQEMSITDEPVNLRIFDTADQSKSESFGFESRFFPLISRLCTFLNPYDH